MAGRKGQRKPRQYFSSEKYENVVSIQDYERHHRSWSFHNIAHIKPLTDTQKEMFERFAEGHHVVAYGSAGTGKTFIALYLALTEILHPASRRKKIILVRSAVPTRDLGYLKGTLEEKIAIYEQPYISVLYELVGRPSTYEDMKKEGLIEFCTTSFVRSLTWSNALIIIDEGQSMTFHEINSVITRLGENSRLIFLGDLAQNDLINKKQEVSGMARFLSIAEHIEEIKIVHFTHEDIVRSPFVKSWIIASENTP